MCSMYLVSVAGNFCVNHVTFELQWRVGKPNISYYNNQCAVKLLLNILR